MQWNDSGRRLFKKVHLKQNKNIKKIIFYFSFFIANNLNSFSNSLLLIRQIEIGMHYKQIENMIDYGVKFKEAKILNEIHTYEKEREKSKNEGT